MTHIAVLGSTNMDLVLHVDKAPRRGETVTGANGTVDRLVPGDEGLIASADALLLQLEIHLAAALAGAQTARGHGVRTILTPAPVQPLPPELLSATDRLDPNEHEAGSLCPTRDAEPLGEERPIREAMTWAAAAATLSVQREGASASMPYRSEIEARYPS